MQNVPQPQYGDVKMREDLKRANPLPPKVAAATPEQIAAQAVAQEEQQGQTDQQAAPTQQGPRRTNQWLIPHKYDDGKQQKINAERARDAGMLWQVLAASSTSPSIRAIAKALAGES